MSEIEDLKIYIVESNPSIYLCLKYAFITYPNIEVINDTIENFYLDNKDKIDCLVSPGNSYGIMDGGYDKGLSNILGDDFQKIVQEYIKKNYYGQQIVGTSFIIKTTIPNLSLIHTPTMLLPSIIKDESVVYNCMRSTLICALNNNIKSLVIPAFGGQCGKVNPIELSNQLRMGYEQILFRKTII